MGQAKQVLSRREDKSGTMEVQRALTDYTTLYIGIGIDFNRYCDTPADAGYLRLPSVEADVRTTILSRVGIKHKDLLEDLSKCMSRDS